MEISDKLYEEIQERVKFYKEHKKNSYEDVFFHSHLNAMLGAVEYAKRGIPDELKEVIRKHLTKELDVIQMEYNEERFKEILALIAWANLTEEFEEYTNKIKAVNNPCFNPKEGEEYKVVYGFVVKYDKGNGEEISSVFRPGHTAIVCKVRKDEEEKYKGRFKEGSLVFKFSTRGEPLFAVHDKKYICNLDTANPRKSIMDIF